MNIRAVDFVMVRVADFAAAAQFYRDVLGLPQRLYSEEYQWAEYDCGNITLALKGGAQSAVARVDDCRIALAVDDIQAAYAELKRRGAYVVGEPEDHGVCRHLEVLDPDGHTLILHQRADGTAG